MQKQKAFSLKQANFTYLFVIASMIAISVSSVWLLVLLDQNALKNYVLEITMGLELIAYIPMIIYAFNCGVDVKSALRIHKPGVKNVLLTILALLCSYILAVVISALWNVLLQLFHADLSRGDDTTKILMQKPAWFALLILCVYAPLFEEFIMRGMVLSGYSAHKTPIKAALITGLLFGVLHGYLPSIAPTAFVGVILALIVLYTGSIFNGMIFHALYNFLCYTAWIDNYFLDLPWKLNLVPAANTDAGLAMKGMWMLGWAVVALIGLIFTLRALKKGYKPQFSERQKPENNRHRIFMWFAVGVAIIYVALSSITLFVKLPGLS